MTPETMHRKLQKKLKHKPYRKCDLCGERMYVKLVSFDDRDGLVRNPFVHVRGTAECLIKECQCGAWQQLFWTGGGTGRHIPHEQSAAERHHGRAGSNPAPSILDSHRLLDLLDALPSLPPSIPLKEWLDSSSRVLQTPEG